MGIAVPVTQLPCNITSQLSQASLLSALQQNFAAIVAGLQATQGYCNNAVAPVIDLSSIANSEILGSQVAGFARPSVAYTEEGVQVQTHIPRYEQIDTNDFLYGLLMEEGTTNIGLYSEQFTNAMWASSGTIAVTDNAIVAPNGTMTAAILAGSTAGAHRYQRMTGYNPAGKTITFSVYLKAPSPCTCKFDVGGYGGPDNYSPALSVTTSWQRFSFTATFTSGQTNDLCPFIEMDTNTIHAWGAQTEVRPYATSYMPTTNASATRSPESMIIPTANIFTPGSWTVEMRYTPKSTVTGSGSLVLWSIENGSTSNLYEMGVNTAGRLYLSTKSGGAQLAITGSSALQVGTTYAILASGNGAQLTLCCNGVQFGQITYIEPVGTLPSMMNIGWAQTTGANQCNGILDDLRISNVAHTITDHKNYISSNQPLPVDANTTLKMDFDQTLRQTSVQRLTNIQGTFTVADALTTSDPSKATHIVPTGWTTAEATIMQAMSELPATGGSIVLMDGTFKVDGKIVVPSLVSLLGQGVSTIIYVNTILPDCAVGDNVALTSNGISITSFLLQGNNESFGIRLLSSTGCLVSNIQFNSCEYPIWLASNNNTITNNIINGTPIGSGISIWSNNSTVSNNQCLNCAYSGIYIGGSYNTVNNNQVNNNGCDGIEIDSGNHNTVSGNNCQGNGTLTNNTYNNIEVVLGNYNNIQTNTCRAGVGANKPHAGIRVTSGISNLVASNDCYTGGSTAGLSDSGTTTSFGAGNRVNSGAWSTTPS
jgi:parallel beta-helix repeat protein